MPVLWPVYLLTVLRTSGSDLAFPALGALMSSRVSAREQGSLMGALGPLWAGAAYDYVVPGAPYWIGAGIFVLAALMLVNRVQHKHSAWQPEVPVQRDR